jgi:glycosyltransferase involved in cell wall biosynthesis
VIVVDNLSRDRTADIARERGALVVAEDEKCLSKVRNRGTRETRGRWLVFVDADP